MSFQTAAPLRRQGPITGVLLFQSRLLEIATAGDGPLPPQGRVGFLVWGGQR